MAAEARVFALAELDEDNAGPDPERVRFWGLESPAGAILHWREKNGRTSWATFDSAARAEMRFGPIFGVVLYWPSS